MAQPRTPDSGRDETLNGPHELFPYLPKEVKIGPYRYRIELVNGVCCKQPNEDGTEDDVVGEIDYEQGVIRLSIQNPHRMIASFWHEVLHGLSDLTVAGLSEGQAMALGPALTAFLLDNYMTPFTDPRFKRSVTASPAPDAGPKATNGRTSNAAEPVFSGIIPSDDGETALNIYSTQPSTMSPTMRKLLDHGDNHAVED